MFLDFNATMPERLKAAIPGSGFRVSAKHATDDSPAELMVMEEIGEWGVPATQVAEFLSANRGRPVDVKINSFGGDVYDGLSIANDLSQHDGLVTTVVNGVAYSAATPIFLAGDVRKMHAMSDFGIHRAWAGAVGNQYVMNSMAAWLATIDNHLVDLYREFSGESGEQVVEWLDAGDGMSGTVFSAEEALEAGFATEVIKMKGKQGKSPSPPSQADHKAAVQTKYKMAMARLALRRHMT